MTLDLNDPIAVLLAATRALADARIEAATYGGLALATYGAARETKDADLAVAAAASGAVAQALRKAGLEPSLAFEKVRFGGSDVTRFTLLPGADQTGLNTLDLVQPRSPRFAALVLGRAREGSLRGQRIRVVTPEEFVLLKILSTRERDLEDAASVLRALEGRLDVEAIREEGERLAREIPDHDVRGRLERALRQSGFES